jgi:hypothetical protein
MPCYTLVVRPRGRAMPIQMSCKACGQPFTCYESDAKRGRSYCSLACRSADRFGRPVPAARNTPVNFRCTICAAPFTMMRSYLAAYRKKHGRDPLYCSRKCSGKKPKQTKRLCVRSAGRMCRAGDTAVAMGTPSSTRSRNFAAPNARRLTNAPSFMNGSALDK